MKTESLEKRLGRRLGQIRTEKNLSQARVAAAAGLSETYISMIENGKRRITVHALSKICAALGISLAEFFADF